MKPKVYIETTIVSYLAAQPSRNVITLARQQITQDWWHQQQRNFELFISELVIREVSAGDQEAAQRRLQVVETLALLNLSEQVYDLAEQLVGPSLLPEQYYEDALHIAIAVVNGIDYLMTWNFKHIGNATLRNKFEPLVRSQGYAVPLICSPEELFIEE